MRLRRERPEVEAAGSTVRQYVRVRGARIGKWLTLEEADYLLVFSLSGASRLKGVHVRDPRHHWWPADCAGGEAAGVCLENEMHMGPAGFSKSWARQARLHRISRRTN